MDRKEVIQRIKTGALSNEELLTIFESISIVGKSQRVGEPRSVVGDEAAFFDLIMIMGGRKGSLG